MRQAGTWAGATLALLPAGCTPQDAATPADGTGPAAPAQCPVAEQDVGQESVDAGQAAPPAPAGVSIGKARLPGSFHAGSNRNRSIEIRADGRHVLTGGAAWDRVESTWSLDSNGKWARVRLCPDHRDTEDLLFVVQSSDVRVLINNDGSSPRFHDSYVRVTP